MPEGDYNIQTKAPYFEKANIKTPIVAAERILKNGALSGSLTLPIYLQSITGDRDTDNNEAKICTIPFYIEENFSFSLANEWKPLVNADLIEGLNDFLNLLSAANTGESQVSMMSTEMQMATWRGSDQPKFTIPMTFVCTQRNYNPVNIIMALSEGALPRRLDETNNPKTVAARDGVANAIGIAGTGLSKAVGGDRNIVGEKIKLGSDTISGMVKRTGLAAPLNFKATVDETGTHTTGNCTLTLQIGNWFRAPELIVERIDNIEFSKEIVAPATKFIKQSYRNNIYGGEDTGTKWGFPLYAKCRLTLRPITYITVDEFQEYFI